MSVKVFCSICGKELWKDITVEKDSDGLFMIQKRKNTSLFDAMKAICCDCILEEAKKFDNEHPYDGLIQ